MGNAARLAVPEMGCWHGVGVVGTLGAAVLAAVIAGAAVVLLAWWTREAVTGRGLGVAGVRARLVFVAT